MFRPALALCLAVVASAPAAATGPYLDQPPPGDEPALFAPGIVSDGLANRDLAITPDGDEIYWSSNLRDEGVSLPFFCLRQKPAALDGMPLAHAPSGTARFARLTQPGAAGRLRLPVPVAGDPLSGLAPDSAIIPPAFIK